MSDPARTTPTRVQRAQNADTGWRKHIEDIGQKLDKLAELMEMLNRADSRFRELNGKGIEVDGHSAETLVRRAAHLIRSKDANTTAEERAAWDAYAAAAMATRAADRVAEISANADALLEERRKRFARKEIDPR